jgi:ParB family chromosome partitioning protein
MTIGDRFLNAPVDQIEPGDNIRETVDELELKGLALSIRENGILIPLEVVPGETRPYRLLDGWRRLCAANLLQLKTVPVRVRDKRPSNGERYQQQLVIQCQRSDLNPMEKSRAVAGYLHATGYSQSEAATKLGFSNAAVTRCVKRLALPPWIQELVESGKIAGSTADVLVTIDDPDRQAALARKAANGALTRDAASAASKQTPASVAPNVESMDDNGGSDISEPTAAEVESEEVIPIRRFKAAFDDGSVTVSGRLTPDSLVAMLTSLLSKARKINSQGLEAEGFFQSLKSVLKHA